MHVMRCAVGHVPDSHLSTHSLRSQGFSRTPNATTRRGAGNTRPLINKAERARRSSMPPYRFVVQQRSTRVQRH